eukprot:6261615-Prymnesium_polylepis.1
MASKPTRLRRKSEPSRASHRCREQLMCAPPQPRESRLPTAPSIRIQALPDGMKPSGLKWNGMKPS